MSGSRVKELLALGLIDRFILFIFGLCLLSACQSEREQETWTYRSLAMDTGVEVQVRDHLSDEQKLELSKILSAEIERIESLVSLERQGSLINQWNRERELVNASQQSEEFFEFIERCFFFHEQTEGLFDITVQPLWEWYWEQSLLEEGQQAELVAEGVLARIGMDKITREGERLSLNHGSSVTLNGIGQGLVTDALYNVLEKYGIESALINAGEYRALGEKEWKVALSSLNEEGTKNVWGEVRLSKGRALAVSARNGYLFSRLKRKPSHIMHPQIWQGGAGEGEDDVAGGSQVRSVGVIAPDATTADALATTFCLATEAMRSRILARFREDSQAQQIELRVDPL